MTEEQLERYKQQMQLPGMSGDAQTRLLSGRVAIYGLSAWGAQAARFLAGVGIGKLIIADLDADNLARLKSELTLDCPDTQIILRTWPQFEGNAAETMLEEVDVVVDGLDNWQHKLGASDLCMHWKKPLIHAGGAGFRFQVYTMLPGKSACLRCVLPEVGMDDVPLTTTDTVALTPVAAMIGALQSVEAVKLIARVGASQGNELWKFDWLSGEFETVRGLDPHLDCPDCGRLMRS